MEQLDNADFFDESANNVDESTNNISDSYYTACNRCGAEVDGDLHPCPYQCDINDDCEDTCNCCSDCEHECAMDI